MSDIVSVGHAGGRERTGYPTQKPLALYQRIIKASSKEKDFVFDPFAGCATTPIAAEKEGREWVACDLWGETLNLVGRRLARDVKVGDVGVLPYYPIHHLQNYNLPERTDGGETAVDYLEPPTKRQKEPWERLTKQKITELLARAQSTNDGMAICAGCGRELEREFMELDHIQPRKGGGTNDITNRILLCKPCNLRKSARYTLPGLQDENRKTKWMRDKRKAQIAQENARRMAEKVRKGEVK